AYQTGEFEMYSGTVPDSIAGKTVLGSVQDGLYPLASGGTFTFKAASSGNTFVSVGDGVNTGNSSGTFSYSKLNSTTGVLRIHSSSGDTTTYLPCTTSTEGGYATVSAGGG